MYLLLFPQNILQVPALTNDQETMKGRIENIKLQEDSQELTHEALPRPSEVGLGIQNPQQSRETGSSAVLEAAKAMARRLARPR